jgi:hypothetical protein
VKKRKSILTPRNSWKNTKEMMLILPTLLFASFLDTPVLARPIKDEALEAGGALLIADPSLPQPFAIDGGNIGNARNTNEVKSDGDHHRVATNHAPPVQIFGIGDVRNREELQDGSAQNHDFGDADKHPTHNIVFSTPSYNPRIVGGHQSDEAEFPYYGKAALAGLIFETRR